MTYVVVDHAQLPPGICFICGNTPDRGTRIIDTQLNFDMGIPHAKRGRMYVCEFCTQLISEALGLEDSEKVREAESFLDSERKALIQLRREFEELGKAAMDRFYKLPVRAVRGQ